MRKRTIAVILLVLLFVVLFVSNIGVPRFIQRFVYAIGQPFWQAQPQVRAEAGSIRALFDGKEHLVSENEALKQEVYTLHLRLADYITISHENERLRGLLDRLPDTSFLAASVLLSPGAGPYDTLIIDVGTENGVSVGDRVFASERVVIGTVMHTEQHASQVRLLSSPGTETAVVLENSNVFLTAVGRGGGNILLEPSSSISLELGERVLLSGITSFLVGTIASIESSPADAVQEVLVRLPVNVYTLQDVFVEL